ncbi:MAG: hypothetical protein COA91_07985 [Robiginitomaculum sp.]|nr:MAG: hypothetical protein COA91_07985 [Robiginitomaculum sp.]
MASGRKALHEIDGAIAKARTNVAKAARMPGRAANALAEVSRKQASAYAQIAKVRLGVIEEGGANNDFSNDLGYADKQAVKLLAVHNKQEDRMFKKADAILAKITKLEEMRRTAEESVEQAVRAYTDAAQACRKKLLKDPKYQALLDAQDIAEATIERAKAKQELAEADVSEKGAPYRADPFFIYLQDRRAGTKQAKGWFLTKWFDAILARRGKYRDAALSYQRLQDIPVRLADHVEDLSEIHKSAKAALQKAEKNYLVREGVTGLKKSSLAAQKRLEKIDRDIEVSEEKYETIRAEQTQIGAGNSAPYREAVDLLVNTLKRKNLPSLKRLAAQTVSEDDDLAIMRIVELTETVSELRADKQEAQSLLEKYQDSLKDLERLRRKFKNRRFDAPSSTFPGANMVKPLLGQLLAGLLSSSDVWRQLERAQRTVRRQSRGYGGDFGGIDFGGIDWGEAMRLPRNTGGFGGGRKRRSRRSSIPRMPRIPRSAPRGGDGFRTGGGF